MQEPHTHFGRIRFRYPEACWRQQSDGTALLLVPDYPLPRGWNKESAMIGFVVPTAYPAAQPDCFLAEAELRLANGAMPRNAGFQSFDGAQWLWFSWHPSSWLPNRDDLTTYLHFVDQ